MNVSQAETMQPTTSDFIFLYSVFSYICSTKFLFAKLSFLLEPMLFYLHKELSPIRFKT